MGMEGGETNKSGKKIPLNRMCDKENTKYFDFFTSSLKFEGIRMRKVILSISYVSSRRRKRETMRRAVVREILEANPR